jgi:hypothetical protein
LSSTDSPLRTDEEFEAQSDEDHHVQPCPLNPLPVGFVTTFALDAMHVCCLGVARRFILYWKGPVGPLNVRLPRKEVCNLSSKLLFLASYVPLEFARKPRSLDEVHRWKATEFREFLLYSGFLVLDGILPGPLYDHFLLLFVANRILMSPQLAVTYADYANELLIKFVHDAESLYGKQTLVYNVHSLIHLAADVKKFGSLENFSAFIFENELGHLKKLVRKPQNPIQQILKRLDEKVMYCIQSPSKISGPITKSEHSRGPLLTSVIGAQQFKQLHSDRWTLTLTLGNNCIMLKDGTPALVKNIVKTRDNVINLVCTQFLVITDAFSFPLQSSKLSIFKVEQQCEQLFSVTPTDIICKCVCWPTSVDASSHIIIPMLH